MNVTRARFKPVRDPLNGRKGAARRDLPGSLIVEPCLASYLKKSEGAKTLSLGKFHRFFPQVKQRYKQMPSIPRIDLREGVRNPRFQLRYLGRNNPKHASR